MDPSPSESSAMEGCSAGVQEVSDSLSGIRLQNRPPVCLIVLGMAGSGKTTFVRRIASHLHEERSPPYLVNLDPACRSVPFPANIDIRDTVKYGDVMRKYRLGPNGAIMTSLNLFSTRIDQVVELVGRAGCRYAILDTPGQIEAFTWSASGMIVTEALSSAFPTVVVYVVDVARSERPATFMSNMLYACGVLYRTRLPLLVALNKTDVLDCRFALDWMRDFEAFDEALGDRPSSFASGLARSMALVLDEFYGGLRAVGVSSLTGAGVGDFFRGVEGAVREYETVFRPERERISRKRKEEERARQEEEMERLRRDAGRGAEVRMEEAGPRDVHSEPAYADNEEDTSDEEWKLRYDS